MSSSAGKRVCKQTKTWDEENQERLDKLEAARLEWNQRRARRHRQVNRDKTLTPEEQFYCENAYLCRGSVGTSSYYPFEFTKGTRNEVTHVYDTWDCDRCGHQHPDPSLFNPCADCKTKRFAFGSFDSVYCVYCGIDCYPIYVRSLNGSLVLNSPHSLSNGPNSVTR